MTRGSRLLGIRAYTPIAPHPGERVEFENREPVAVGQAENKNLKMLAVTSRIACRRCRTCRRSRRAASGASRRDGARRPPPSCSLVVNALAAVSRAAPRPITNRRGVARNQRINPMQNPSMISRKRFHFAHQPRDGRYSEASVFEAFLLPFGSGRHSAVHRRRRFAGDWQAPARRAAALLEICDAASAGSDRGPDTERENARDFGTCRHGCAGCKMFDRGLGPELVNRHIDQACGDQNGLQLEHRIECEVACLG